MYDIYDNDFDKAFDEAVDAIEKKEHRLIWADDLIACKFKNPISYNAFANLVKRQPTVEAEPIKHGRWDTQILDGIMGNRPQAIFCDKCGQIAFAKTNYCPNCGARMDEVEE